MSTYLTHGRGRKLSIDALYSGDPAGKYWYNSGYNPGAILALVMGVLPNIPGFLAAAGLVRSVEPIFSTIYTYAWFVGFVVASLVYYAAMRVGLGGGETEETNPY